MKKTLALLCLYGTIVAMGFSTAVAQAKTILQTSGNGQTDTVSTSLSQPFVVTITDSLGTPVSGVAVNFALTGAPSGAAGQSLSITAMNTDLNGRASTLLTLGSKVGLYSVSASSDGLVGNPIGFTAMAIAGPAKNITITSGDGQSGQVTTALANPFVVTVTDATGNPVAGRSVTFAVVPPANGATLSVMAVNTDTLGQAKSGLTLGTKKGTYLVTATSSGLTGSPVTFTSTANPGPATKVTIETAADGLGTLLLPQNLQSGSSLTGYAITRDVYDNFVANAQADSFYLFSKSGGVDKSTDL
ncbi:hypothetical protein EHM92_02085, partial [bacterium]